MVNKIKFPFHQITIILLIAVLTLVACSATHQELKTYPSINRLSLPSITQMVVQTMQLMGYQIKDWNDSNGHVYGKKPIDFRFYHMTVDVITNAQGDKSVAVKCIADQVPLAPSGQEVQNFYKFFSKVAKSSTFSTQAGYPQAGEVSKESSTGGKGGWLGIGVQDMTFELSKKINLKEAKGALIAQVLEGSPASEADLRTEDVILEVAGKPILDSHDLVDAIGMQSPGSSVILRVWRSGDAIYKAVTLGKYPADSADTQKAPTATSSSEEKPKGFD